jgi:hypothetical protein
MMVKLEKACLTKSLKRYFSRGIYIFKIKGVPRNQVPCFFINTNGGEAFDF